MGWYLLAIAILYKNPVSVEGAEKIWYGKDCYKKKDINKEMYDLRQEGMTFEAIGEMFGLSKSTTFRRIKRMAKNMQIRSDTNGTQA